MEDEIIIAGYTVDELAEKWQEGYAEYVKSSLEYHNDPDMTEADVANIAEQDTWNWMRVEFGPFGFDDEIENKISDILSAKQGAE